MKIIFTSKDIEGKTSELGFLLLTTLKKSIKKIIKSKCKSFLTKQPNIWLVSASTDNQTICEVKRNLQLSIF
jgi:hypothetical protein